METPLVDRNGGGGEILGETRHNKGGTSTDYTGKYSVSVLQRQCKSQFIQCPHCKKESWANLKI